MSDPLTALSGPRIKGPFRDDRLDALAIAVAYWVEQMAQDSDKSAEKHLEKLRDKEIQNFLRNAKGGVNAHPAGQRKGKSMVKLVCLRATLSPYSNYFVPPIEGSPIGDPSPLVFH